ncbi:ribosome small subunit-dependent GTPase A [candidate division KSB1 bacterium]|nr:ribosome small subunit-dependent GTPase A [candidate division KSB1 bacterium]
MKDLTKIEQKQLRHLMQERKARLRLEREEEREEEAGAEAEDVSLRESLLRQIAKGVSQLVIVGAFGSPPLAFPTLDRLLILAQREELETLLCLNKIDLLKNRAEAERIARVYRKLDYAVMTTSAATGEGFAELRHKLEQKRSMLVGDCGVGKTALLKALDPYYEQKRTTRDLILSVNSGDQINCSIHEYKLVNATEVLEVNGVPLHEHLHLPHEEVHRYFPEFFAPSRECMADDCLHLREEDCGVKQAVEDGVIAKHRHESYMRIVEALR